MTSTSAISDAVARVQQLEQQLQQLQSGALLKAVLGTGSGTGVSGSGAATGAATGSAAASFAGALAQAQAQQVSPTASTASGSLTPNVTGLSASGLTGMYGSSGVAGAYSSGGYNLSGGVALPPGATSQLTSAQQQFASTLSADTGLNPGVVSAWLLAEESGGAAQARQAAGNNDWLNVGYTDSGTYGAGDPIWSDPVSAANATAAWMKGQVSIAGYGQASGGVQSIMQSVGQSPAAQIAALQSSGWASSGYPDLTSLYSQVTGTDATSGAPLSIGAGGQLQ